MKFVNIRDEIVEIPGDSWPVDLPELPADVVMVVFPDDGDPWIERDPFEGREKNPEIVDMVRHLLIKPEEEEPADEQDEQDAFLVLMQDLEAVYADHADTPGAEAARDAVRDIIPTLTDPESYDVEIAFRAHIRSQP